MSMGDSSPLGQRLQEEQVAPTAGLTERERGLIASFEWLRTVHHQTLHAERWGSDPAACPAKTCRYATGIIDGARTVDAST